jgi:polysaccharide deacetylase 2 family uncharacterized protein YibQ
MDILADGIDELFEQTKKRFQSAQKCAKHVSRAISLCHPRKNDEWALKESLGSPDGESVQL